ncbi:uncharacterized protein [Pyrus communis]|uniref:uncharacterized protein n=1 Tax=Pyrus communis TaxID=23211 RepID=UPI0035C033E8
MSSSRRLSKQFEEQQKRSLAQQEELFNLEKGGDEAFAMEEDEDDEHKRRCFRMQQSLFDKIMSATCNHDPYFVQKRVTFHVQGLLPEQKITADLRILAYGPSTDQVDEITRMGKSTALKSLMQFCSTIESLYTNEYLRTPMPRDM